MVTTNERSPIAISISAVAPIWNSAPSIVHGQNFHLGRGSGAPVTDNKPMRNNSAKGKPNRNRTCVAPAVPSVPVNSRCIALRTVWAKAAMTVKMAHSHAEIITPSSRRLFRSDHVIHVDIGRKLPAVGEQIVDHANLIGDIEPALR